jgi:hypothetical protein
MIEHLVYTDQLPALLGRCSKTNGSLIITAPNLVSLENRIRLLFGFYPKWADWCTSEGVGHVRAYTIEILTRQLAGHGFYIRTVLGSCVPYSPRVALNKYRLTELGFTDYLFPSLFEGMKIHAVKACSHKLGSSK